MFCNHTSISFGHNVISFISTAYNLGYYYTNDTRIDAYAQDISRQANIDIRRIDSIRHLPSIDASKTLLSAFVLPKLDYGNCTFYGSQNYMLEMHQIVQSSAVNHYIRCTSA